MTNTRIPITQKEIRIDDLIRWENGDEAKEWRVTADSVPMKGGQHYLLQRPEVAAVLPIEPTLAWVTVDGVKVLSDVSQDGADSKVDGKIVPSDSVTDFVPATAVPIDALAELRNAIMINDDKNQDLKAVIEAFLLAVDESNKEKT